MFSTTDAGRLGEAKAIAKLVEFGWYPFSDLSGKCPVDIIAWKDGAVKTFQVKTTNSLSNAGNYIVQIGSVRPNRTGNVIRKFGSDGVDYLVAYVIPTDRVYFIPSGEITTGRCLTIKERHNEFLQL